ncbi:MAG: hypothetical protein JOZ41_13850 [Chloroflexi bacterium]|nr:hypothetical protein [Chloroflexota bacterium]
MVRIGRNHLGVLALIAAGLALAGWAAKALAGAPNTWATVAPLPAGRMGPAAASAGGLLYVFGGGACSTPGGWCRTFESFNPRTNRWTSRGNMPQALGGLLSATTGPNNRIYLVSSGGLGAPGGTLVYDARTNTWKQVKPPPGVQDSAQLVTGSHGRIYAVGGRVSGNWIGALSSFNPGTDAWTALPPFPVPRPSPAAAAGPDGRIYVIGGFDQSGKSDRVDAYSPKTNSWSPAAPLPTGRAELQAVTGPDGRIYAIGGGAGSRCLTSPCDVVEAYDVRRNTWTAVAPLPHPRWVFAAAVGPDGRIYVLGGAGGIMSGTPLTVVDAYTVVPAGQPLPTPRPGPTPLSRQLAPMPTGRQNLALAAGGDGKIYALGGESVIGPQSGPVPDRKILRTVEAYDPKTGAWAREPDLPVPRTGLAATTGLDGRIYVLGGTAGEGTATNPPESLASVAIFDPKAHRWSAGTPMPDGRSQLAAVTGTDGRVYVIGGLSYTRAVTVCEPVGTAPSGSGPPGRVPCGGPNTAVAYDPRTDTWTHLADLHAERVGAAAAAGRDGRVYVFGGANRRTGLYFTSAEVYDPRTNRWSPIAPMPHARYNGFAAATAKDGRIFLIGGCVGWPGNHGCALAAPSPVDVYDPAHNTWTTIGSTVYATAGSAAATGPDGRIYVAGGVGDGNGHLLQVLSP